MINAEEKIILEATLPKFIDFNIWLESACEKLKIKSQDLMKLTLVSEEIFANISNYAYPCSTGDVEAYLKKNDNEITLKFIDEGIEYNPLKKEDSDITLGIQERPVGGLGIFMVKNTVDFIDYKYEDNKNKLTVKIMYK